MLLATLTKAVLYASYGFIGAMLLVSIVGLVLGIVFSRAYKTLLKAGSSELFEIPYTEITKKIDDYRAKRITSYLNLINKLVEDKFNELKNSTIEKADEIKKYFSIRLLKR